MPPNPLDRAESGRRLKAARESLGLSQAAAAARLGVTRQQLAKVENGRTVPLWTNLVGIVTTLGLDPRTVAPEFFAPAAGAPGIRKEAT